jgi:hypothetical protein
MHRQACFLSFLSLSPSLTRTQYMSIAGVSHNTAARDIAELLAAGLIRRVGSGPSSRYCLATSPFLPDLPSPSQPVTVPTIDPERTPPSVDRIP